MKKLYRSSKNKVWLGVFGGLGEYLNIDPVLLRLIFILVFVFTGFVPGLIVYILAAIVMPKKG
ncbi:MAG: PspC domain-containing protein [Candidatus Daviesbacteria bacterium]|nr:PspC domain-containing protein [Candidatus Daviesbacteria bacterium]